MRKQHGFSHTQEYYVWQGMKARCYRKGHRSYKDYGGRGITVCNEWLHDFTKFFKDMGSRPSPEHTLDRIDNNGPYSKENCRWSTVAEQNRNNRRVRRFLYKGKQRTMREISEDAGIHYLTFKSRILYSKMSVDQAIKKPVGLRKLTDAQVVKIKKLIAKGYTKQKISEMFSVSPGTIGNIFFGRMKYVKANK